MVHQGLCFLNVIIVESSSESYEVAIGALDEIEDTARNIQNLMEMYNSTIIQYQDTLDRADEQWALAQENYTDDMDIMGSDYMNMSSQSLDIASEY